MNYRGTQLTTGSFSIKSQGAASPLQGLERHCCEGFPVEEGRPCIWTLRGGGGGEGS